MPLFARFRRMRKAGSSTVQVITAMRMAAQLKKTARSSFKSGAGTAARLGKQTRGSADDASGAQNKMKRKTKTHSKRKQTGKRSVGSGSAPETALAVRIGMQPQRQLSIRVKRKLALRSPFPNLQLASVHQRRRLGPKLVTRWKGALRLRPCTRKQLRQLVRALGEICERCTAVRPAQPANNTSTAAGSKTQQQQAAQQQANSASRSPMQQSSSQAGQLQSRIPGSFLPPQGQVPAGSPQQLQPQSTTQTLNRPMRPIMQSTAAESELLLTQLKLSQLCSIIETLASFEQHVPGFQPSVRVLTAVETAVLAKQFKTLAGGNEARYWARLQACYQKMGWPASKALRTAFVTNA